MQHGSYTPSRRQVLGMGLGLAAGSLVHRPWAQAANFDWMQQKGKSIVVTAPLATYYTVLKGMIPDFTKLTGIDVEYQVVPEQQLRQKLPIEMNAKSPGIDVFASSMHVEKILFSAAGWYEPLNKYLDSPNLTPPDYNWKDFGPAGTYWGLKSDGTVRTTLHVVVISERDQILPSHAIGVKPIRSAVSQLTREFVHPSSKPLFQFIAQGNATTSCERLKLSSGRLVPRQPIMRVYG